MESIGGFPGDEALKGFPTPTEVISESKSARGTTCEVITGFESLFDFLPSELLHIIARDSEPAYKAMLVYPRFARSVTPGTRIDYMIDFGHDVVVRKDEILRIRYGILHNLQQPSQRYNVLFRYCRGLLHCENEPAVIYPDGVKKWYWKDKLHCNYGPAVLLANGDYDWYEHGRLHRDDGPARFRKGWHMEWWRKDMLYGVAGAEDDYKLKSTKRRKNKKAHRGDNSYERNGYGIPLDCSEGERNERNRDDESLLFRKDDYKNWWRENMLYYTEDYNIKSTRRRKNKKR